jgi:DedD protein
MPPDSQNEQELMFKKRARRRLVGAVALVLLMIVLLPQVLQDRALLVQQDPIKILMHEPVNSPPDLLPSEDTINFSEQTQFVDPEEVVLNQPLNGVKSETLPPPVQNTAVENASSSQLKPADTQSTIVNPPAQAQENYTVQVGVYSDAVNVKRLQDQLKQAGFMTITEKIRTEKGESIRLKAGSYLTRQDATVALEKIKDLGLPGIVVSQRLQSLETR